MRRQVFGIVVLVIVLCSSAYAQNTFTFYDDFEAGIGNWTPAPPQFGAPPGSTAMNLDTSVNAVPIGGTCSMHAIYSGKMYHNFGAEITGAFVASWYIYDDGLDFAYGELRAYKGAGLSGPELSTNIEQLFGAGKFSIRYMDSTLYQGRVMYDGTSYGGSWFNLDNPNAPRRSQGWHLFEIERLSDGTLNWYVDSILSATRHLPSNAPFGSIDCITLGYGNSIVISGDTWYDGFYINGTVPEPSACVALLSGILGAAAIIRRRRI